MLFNKAGKDDKRVSGMQESRWPSDSFIPQGWIQPPGTSLKAGEVAAAFPFSK